MLALPSCWPTRANVVNASEPQSNGLLTRRVDGLLLAQVGGSPLAVVESIMAQRAPVVLQDRLSTPDVDQVGVEPSSP